MTDRIRSTLLWSALLLAIAIGAAIDSQPRLATSHRLDMLPVSGANFSSESLPLSSGEQSIFGSAGVLKRLYRYRHQRFILVAVDGTENRHAVHDPLYCLRGAGWQIDAKRQIAIDGGQAQLLNLSHNGERREALFWFSDGMSRHTSILRYWWQSSLRRVSFGRSGTEPVLFILQSLQNEKPDWQWLLNGSGLFVPL